VSGHLTGKNIAVTGAGNGIGRGIALACAAEGANVVVADYGVSLDGRDPSSEVADGVVAEITAAGGTAVAVAGDVSKMEVGQQIIDTAVDNWGSIDGVVCVAGIVRERMLFNMSEEEFDDVVAVHLKGHFTLYRAASAVMRKQESGGSLVGFTSGAFVASTAQANYSAAKGGVVSLTRSAAFALRRYGINANCIAPTAMTRMSENVPFEIEAGAPEDIAPLAVYLLSDAARDITAQTYTCTGSRIAVWNQPVEVREMTANTDGVFTVDEIAERLPVLIGHEEMPMFADLERRMKEMAEQKAAEEASS
jgi:NAD(P)-dependent dehydrogenase (short-subunit alcohol dehydrogenase family)|tara:strand:+ start:11037 stop:11957 length:921 start_codon:yes stop_codon:yes gene_type:complete